MHLLYQIVVSIGPMVNAIDEQPNLLIVLVMFASTFWGMFLIGTIASTVLALIDRSAALLSKHRIVWLPYPWFDYVLNGVFVLLILPICLVTAQILAHGFDGVALFFCFTWISGTHEGLFVGYKFDENGHFPNIWDFIDRALPGV